jgi:hypothetical protein
MLAIGISDGIGAPAYEEEEEELLVSRWHGRQQLGLHLAEYL